MPEIKKFLDQEGVRFLWEAFKANYGQSGGITEKELLDIFLKNAPILQADWDETDETSLNFIRNKPNALEALALVTELDLVHPVVDAENNVYIDKDGYIIIHEEEDYVRFKV